MATVFVLIKQWSDHNSGDHQDIVGLYASSELAIQHSGVTDWKYAKDGTGWVGDDFTEESPRWVVDKYPVIGAVGLIYPGKRLEPNLSDCGVEIDEPLTAPTPPPTESEDAP